MFLGLGCSLITSELCIQSTDDGMYLFSSTDLEPQVHIMHLEGEDAACYDYVCISLRWSLQRKPEIVNPQPSVFNIGASIITNTMVGVPDYHYSITGPKTLF